MVIDHVHPRNIDGRILLESHLSELSRRDFVSKSVLAALGGGAIFLAMGGGSIGSTPEIDPLAILRSPSSQQTIQPLVDNIFALKLKQFQHNGFTDTVLLCVDQTEVNHIALDPGNGLNSPSIIELASDSGISGCGINYVETGIGGLTVTFMSIDSSLSLGAPIKLGATTGAGSKLGLQADDATLGGGIKFFDSNGTETGLIGTGAQIGLPTSALGSQLTLTKGDHRHAFSGRFTYSGIEFNALLPGGAFPDNFARIKINNNWTLRRIWAFTKNGPTGGTETYGLVNAGGVLQGVAVVLPASAGAVSQAESGLQIANLTGGTLYYLAQTASAAIVASTNVEVGIEYTMNV
jgi:hypothetical protein